jgi:hypothetical protein
MAQGTIEEQLRKAQIEAAKLRERLKTAAKKAKKGGDGWTPPFDGAHRGY